MCVCTTHARAHTRTYLRTHINTERERERQRKRYAQREIDRERETEKETRTERDRERERKTDTHPRAHARTPRYTDVHTQPHGLFGFTDTRHRDVRTHEQIHTHSYNTRAIVFYQNNEKDEDIVLDFIVLLGIVQHVLLQPVRLNVQEVDTGAHSKKDKLPSIALVQRSYAILKKEESVLLLDTPVIERPLLDIDLRSKFPRRMILGHPLSKVAHDIDQVVSAPSERSSHATTTMHGLYENLSLLTVISSTRDEVCPLPLQLTKFYSGPFLVPLFPRNRPVADPLGLFPNRKLSYSQIIAIALA
ncbi:hypothetical protein EVAR_68471_1 [Eumeta japonica]|uniref:Uncharacterized protein n=1 Tax=Eumeta variegata TaxID=151549 RepID=A0A4C2A7P1_EUMVA|nr:hypothetical protein EVAR_68471_1 [Eumeta japonica]